MALRACRLGVLGTTSAGAFVAVGASGKILRTIDGGLSWESVTNPFGTSSVNAVAYRNGVFVAVTADGKIARSTDGGYTWGSLISNGFGGGDIKNVCGGGVSTFVAVDGSGNVARSTDGGVTWSSLSSISGSLSNAALAYDGTNFIAGLVTAGNAATIKYSADGATWTTATTLTGLTVSDREIGAIVANTSAVVAGVNSDGVDQEQVGRSTDNGVNFTSITSPAFTGFASFISACQFGTTMALATLAAQMAVSTDSGATYGTVLTITGITTLGGIATTGIAYIAVGDGGKIRRSVNTGTSWVTITSPIATSLADIAAAINLPAG